MDSVYLFTAPGSLVTMWKDVDLETSPADAPQEFLSALNAIETLAVPLAVNLSISAYPIDLPLPESSVEAEVALWSLREADWPEHVVEPGFVDSPSVKTVRLQHYCLDTVRESLHVALAQPAPDGYVMTIEKLTARHTRTCIGPDSVVRARTLEVRYHDAPRSVPLEARDGLLWVAGPLRDTSAYAPVVIEMINWGVALQLSLNFGWSMFSPGTFPHERLVAVLTHLRQRGWRTKTVDGVRGLPADLLPV